MCEDHGNPEHVDEDSVDENNKDNPNGQRSADPPGLGTELALEAVDLGVSSIPRAATSTAVVAGTLSEGSEEAVSSAAQTSYEVIEASAEDGISIIESAGDIASELIEGAVEFIGSILS